MSQDQFLSVSDIVRELNAGKGTVKFILNKFKDHIPCRVADGQDVYPARTLTIITDIMEKMNMGELPNHIAEELMNKDQNGAPQTIGDNYRDVRISHDGLNLLRTLINDIGEQQKRIARAHEKRAQAEERKAVAIEKRAEAEERKAEAMNNIANALQEMNQLRTPIDPALQQISHEAVQVVTTDEQDLETSETESEVEDLLGEEFEDELSSLIEEDDFLSDTSDRTDLEVDTEETSDLDDLSLLVDTSSKEALQSPDDLSSLIDDAPAQDIQLDDLNELLDEGQDRHHQEDMDDLYALIDTVDSQTTDRRPEEPDATDIEMDDLSKLIETEASVTDDITPIPEMDDLSQLIETHTGEEKVATKASAPPEIEEGMDDLSLLIDAPDQPVEQNQEDTDLLTGSQHQEAPVQMDDLSKLIEDDFQEPISDTADMQTAKEKRIKAESVEKITIEADPEDVKQYKAAIMKAIIGLKNDGKTPEQTTQILNESNVKTISGKPEWSLKAVEQIYGFIKSASG